MAGSNDLQPVVDSKITPEVFDESGNKIVGPEMEAAIGLVSQLAQVAQLTRIRKSMEREHIEGKSEEKTLSATDQRQFINLVTNSPHQPWATASFVNDGPNDVYISINDISHPTKLKARATGYEDYTKAEKRIRVIFYWCDPGETASVTATGKY